MILVVGGIHSGKKTFVREALGFSEGDSVCAASLADEGRGALPSTGLASSGKAASGEHHGRVAVGCEELARACDEARILSLLEPFDVVVIDEVGAGVVPVRGDDATWRERVGRVSCALAERADAVVRMVCGIPQVIKGDLATVSRGGRRADQRPIAVTLVRHGATAGTQEHRYSGGGTDEALSPEGVQALRNLAPREDIRRVVTSGMARTDQTARILFPDADIAACPDLREMDFGAFEGRRASDMEDDARYRAWVDAWCRPSCPGGEGKDGFTARVVAAFRGVCEREAALGSTEAVLVVHSGTIRAVLSELAVPKKGYFDVHTEPGGAWRGVWDGAALTDVRPLSGACAR